MLTELRQLLAGPVCEIRHCRATDLSLLAQLARIALLDSQNRITQQQIDENGRTAGEGGE